MKKYALIIFDMDGTLYSFENGAYDIYSTTFYKKIEQNGVDFISRKLNMNRADAQKIRKSIFDKYNGNISIGLKKEFNIEREEYFNSAWDIDAAKYLKPAVQLDDMLARIKIKKAVLSSAPEVWVQRAIKQLGIYEQLDGVWCDDGIKKPDVNAYLRVTNAFNVLPQDTLIVEDEVRYLVPAKELGMTTVLIGSEKNRFIDYNIKTIYEIQSIEEIKSIIGGG